MVRAGVVRIDYYPSEEAQRLLNAVSGSRNAVIDRAVIESLTVKTEPFGNSLNVLMELAKRIRNDEQYELLAHRIKEYVESQLPCGTLEEFAYGTATDALKYGQTAELDELVEEGYANLPRFLRDTNDQDDFERAVFKVKKEVEGFRKTYGWEY